MSKMNIKIKQMKKELDSISGYDGKYCYSRLLAIDKIMKILISDMKEHEKMGEDNCSLLEDYRIF